MNNIDETVQEFHNVKDIGNFKFADASVKF